MELRHLRYFIAVAEEQNVTRAAARLNVSQPPLSRQIKDLEEELGVALFERTGKSVRLTDAGRMFLAEARAIMARAEKAIQLVRDAVSGGSGELHVGYAPSPTVEILPAALRAFRKKCPKVRVVLHDMASPEMLGGLREGKLDAALMVRPSKQAGRGLLFETLREFPIVVMLPPGHPLARRKSLSVADVGEEWLVTFSRADYPDYHEMLVRILGPARYKRTRFAEECDSGTSLITAVESGKGIAFSASIVAATAGRRLKYVPLAPAPSPLIVGVAYRSEEKDPITRSFLETVRALPMPRMK